MQAEPAKPPHTPMEQRLVSRLQNELAEKWPGADAEITATAEDMRQLFSLRFARLRHVRTQRHEEEKTTRQIAQWLRRRLTDLLPGTRVSTVFCPVPRQHTDFKAPRFSHYNGNTWIFCVAYGT